jgi:hypothetical protein
MSHGSITIARATTRIGTPSYAVQPETGIHPLDGDTPLSAVDIADTMPMTLAIRAATEIRPTLHA